jgi:hypothetical protein
MRDAKMPRPFRIEHLCHLPYNLARTELVVRPCVAFLDAVDSNDHYADESLIPRLDAKEVAAVFSAPFGHFLRASDDENPARGPESLWYEGAWTTWHDRPWHMHAFYVPVDKQRVTRPRVRDGGLAALAEHGHDETAASGETPGEDGPERFKVWGMTARIIVDAATVAYGEQPEFEHNSHFGDEDLITALYNLGRLGEKRRSSGRELTGADSKKAKGSASKM